MTISPAAREALERFSQASGVASSSFIASIVDDSIPIIEAMTRAYQTARSSPRKAADAMQSELVRAMASAAQAQLELGEAVGRKSKPRRRPRKSKRD